MMPRRPSEEATVSNIESQSANRRKLPFVAGLETTDKMSAGQRKFADQYNLMRQTLIENGLMETN